MITKDSFKKVLEKLDFKEENSIYTKKFIEFDCELKVDFKNEQFIYPKEIEIDGEFTLGFHQNESFVVFECVHRLLTKGYKPNHILLEPKWKLGHGASGGRADILVKNQSNEPLLIIECKTFSREFEKAWKETIEDGGQLFSYIEQEKAVEFIALYASDFIDNEIIIAQKIISHKDNETILNENRELKSFKNAKNVKERFKVWQNTYKLEFTEKGIFEENIQAYKIGKDKYTLLIDTKPIDATDKKGKYHQFRTILRKYNVSRRENAFEVLVNLFLCKIVDETENPNNLKFYWKGIAYDNYFDLVDRLQELYKIGMDKFLKQEIVYVSNKDIDELFWAMKQKQNATKDEIKKLFRQLKFFKGLDFEFIKVHNQKQFEKNAKILLEIIQMWQGLRLLSTGQNQFLGDMFEFFLDNGIKQSEGQFFTPVPICKFIVSSLPLESMVQNSNEPIKTIDYACGAGHFLNEYALSISPIVQKYKNSDVKNYFKHIFGIEKEDRLAKVAKVSAFMYGQDEINIIENDALDNHEMIKNSNFDCLIANPPFAVEDFLLTLDEEIREKYELYETINELGNKNIQCFFLERAKQLLAPNGIAGIIVPSSILNNSDNTHIKTREILLKYFDFISIVELGSGTFGKTGTNTVILFIRRKGLKPEVSTHFKNRVDDFFENWESEKNSSGGAYGDIAILKKYSSHIEVDFEIYENLLLSKLDDKLFEYEMFIEYKKAFENSTEIKNHKNKKIFKDKTEDLQQLELDKKLLDFIITVEKEKLLYFMLSFNNDVLIVKSPTDTKEQKSFLGYEWSGAKGSEGIKYNGADNIHDIETPLFDPKDRANITKISYLIREQFLNNTKLNINEELQNYVSRGRLVDMLDFSRVEFNKAINLNVNKKVEIESKWELVKLVEIVDLLGGFAFKSDDYVEYSNTLNFRQANIRPNGILDLDYKKTFLPDNFIEKYKDFILKDNDVVIAMTDMNKELNLLAIPTIIKTNGYNLLLNQRVGKFFNYDLTKLLPAFLNEVLKSHLVREILKSYGYGNIQSNLSKNDLLNLKIPLPPLEIQNQIVQECQMVDDEVAKANEIITKAKETIENNYKELLSKADKTFRLSNSDIFDVFIGKRVLSSEITQNKNNGIAVYSANVFEPFGFIDKYFIEDFSKGSVLWGIDGDWLVNYISPNIPFYPTDHCGLIRVKTNDIHPKYLALALNVAGIENRFSRSNRASTERVKGINIKAPSIQEQLEVISKIETLETQINEAKKVIDEAKEKKEEILRRYL